MEGKDLPKINALIDQIEMQPEMKETGEWLKEIKRKNLKHFNDLTHGGIYQVVRRITEEEIQSAYPENELSNLLKYFGEVAIQTALRFFVITEKELLITETGEKAAMMRQFWINN